MAYTLIKGSFHIHYPDNPLSGPEPDGDTLKFQPDHPHLLNALPRPNRAPAFNTAGITSIRFEGIDALETHFEGDAGEYHQHLALAIAARDQLLERAGFGEVRYFAHRPYKVESVEHHPVRGYILSAGLDTYGRAVAFVFTGEHSSIDGARIFLAPDMLEASLNAWMLREGHAYGTFFLGLPPELREYLRTSVQRAREAGLGVWAHVTATGAQGIQIDGLDTLQQHVLWPKLFRRLVPYFEAGHTDFAAFDAWLREDTRHRDDRLLLPTLEVGNMHDVIITEGRLLRLACAPEDVVIVPDDYVLPATVHGVQATRPAHPSGVRIVAALINPATRPERGNETVTVLNTGEADVDMRGWRIADIKGHQTLDGTLAHGDTLRIRLTGAVRLNNTRDTITLLDADGALVDQVSYEPRDLPREGRSMVF